MIIKTKNQYEAVKTYQKSLAIFRQELAKNQDVPAEIHELVDGEIEKVIRRLHYLTRTFEHENDMFS